MSCWLLHGSGAWSQQAAAAVPDFNFEVRPVLAAKCFSCHGSDVGNRKGKLRLDDRAAAIAKEAIVPGDTAKSKLIERILTTDPDELMPPPDRHQELTAAEKEVLRRWVVAGAEYAPHWAFTAPVKPTVPEISTPGSEASAQKSPLHPIDAFVAERLAKEKIAPAPEANPAEWLRRVTFALTGLPPTAAEVAEFLRDAGESSAAYERVVDRLLQSPHFGEKLARDWLDAARYGDTYGRHEDADCEVGPWRDWVIRAFNDNLPYDQFIQWQMAGDLLPNATQDQVVATAFHRLPVQSNESGSDPEEFRWDQVFDRIKTTATAVMGLTLECARCHDHKYDPFTMRDYYQLAAYFDNIDELGLFSRYTNGIPPPTTFVYKSGEQARHEELKQAVRAAEAALKTAREAAAPRFTAWLEHNAPPGQGAGLWSELADRSNRVEALARKPETYFSFDLVDVKKLVFLADLDPKVAASGGILVSEDVPGRHGKGVAFLADKGKKYGIPDAGHYLRWQPFTFSLWLKTDKVPERGVILHRSRAGLDAANRGYELTFEDGKLTATLGHFYPGNAIRVQAIEKIEFNEWRHIGYTYDGSSRAAGIKLYLNGKLLPVKIVRDHLYRDIDYLVEWGDLDNAKVADADKDLIGLKIGGRTLDMGLRGCTVDEFRAYDAELSAVEIARLAELPEKSADASWLDWYVREIDPPARAALASLQAARQAENEFSTHLTELMVMREREGPRRATTMLNRGDFHQPGEVVAPGTPRALPPLPADAPKDRRGFAQWLTNPGHPLTARVQVNRLWTLFFGRGMVPTPEDFGVQGRVPSHPQLLDWLATHFIESGWDIKALCREIALSKTYRQSSLPADPTTRAADPNNDLLARGPRFRLSAEELRDAALAASGLLNRAIGGRSVNPYQPGGLWEDSGTQHVYKQDHGDKLWRRSLYTFWRRTCPPPTMSVFDAPTREFCRVKRESTTTPLQSLALMNDTAFLEAARVLAEKLVRARPQPADQSARVDDAFLLLTAHPPTAAQTKTMTALMDEARAHYAANAAEAETLLAATGESPPDAELPATEVAATMLMARAVLNSEPFISSY